MRSLRLNPVYRIFQVNKTLYSQRKTNNTPFLISSVLPSQKYPGVGILTDYPLATAFAIALGPPNPWLTSIAKETLDFRGSEFSSDF